MQKKQQHRVNSLRKQRPPAWYRCVKEWCPRVDPDQETMGMPATAPSITSHAMSCYVWKQSCTA